MTPNFDEMLPILSLTKTKNGLAKKNLAACQRILCAGRSPILAKKKVFLKNSN
jgi:hypothetical protein